MQYVVLGAFIAFALAVAASGVVGLITGWIHPWERARVLRPVPHGLGQVFAGSGLSCLFGAFTFNPRATCSVRSWQWVPACSSLEASCSVCPGIQGAEAATTEVG